MCIGVQKIIGLVVLACSVMVVGCATPRHTNTLIFATNTKVALDVSQDPTGFFGATIGYKRQEGVWMPLLANEKATDEKGELIPAACSGDDCKIFVGATKSSKGEVDAYSVLASFGGSATGDATNPSGKAVVAQYFATGLAARLLAQNGGAAIVNTNADPAVATTREVKVTESTQQLIDKAKLVVGRILAATAGSDKALVDSVKMKELANKSSLEPNVKAFLNAIKSTQNLQTYLEGNYETVALPLSEALGK